MPITAKVRGNQPGRTGPELSVDLLLRSRRSAFGAGAGGGVGYPGLSGAQPSSDARLYVAGPGDKARVT